LSNKVNLSSFNNNWFQAGGNSIKRFLWFYVNAIFINSSWLPVSRLKVFLLKLFGATIGKGCVIKPSVNVKYPWKLALGNHVWIGENVWIDNLEVIEIGSNVCISQGAFLLCGNHDYSKSSFDLIVKPIKIEDGCWVGAKAVVCPGVKMNKNAILVVGSVASKDLDENGIYRGNPAVKIRQRSIKT
jgi:putative colanic acid biosynthesis acetyltransferase WcaF